MGTESHCSVSLPSPSFSEQLLSRLLSNGSLSGGPFPLPDGSPSCTTSYMRDSETGESSRHDTTISTLPDNVLLEIFDLSRERYRPIDDHYFVWDWHILVHVCRRWREIIFDSPNRLNLRIFCTYETPVRENLSIWPALPIVIDYANHTYSMGVPLDDEDNLVAALEHPDRVSHLGLSVTGSQLVKMVTMMQEPFPMLASLCIQLEFDDYDASVFPSVLPADLLGGSAPRLRLIELDGTPFPALPTLLLSATDLVWLHLFNLPPTSYIAPETMAASLAGLPRLEEFVIEFQSASSRPDRISPPPVLRTVLPALTFIGFKGASEYLEDFITQIDSPQLDQIRMDYLDQFVDFQVAQVSKFIDRSIGPKSALFRHASVTFFSDNVSFEMDCHKICQTSYYPCLVSTSILCLESYRPTSHIARVLSNASVTLSNVVHLKLTVVDTHPEKLEGTGDVAWPLLFHQFSNLQTLHVSRTLAKHVALALERITGEMAVEVFPSLILVYLAGQPVSSIRNFVTSRQLSDRPITVVNTKMEFDDRRKSYVSQ